MNYCSRNVTNYVEAVSDHRESEAEQVESSDEQFARMHIAEAFVIFSVAVTTLPGCSGNKWSCREVCRHVLSEYKKVLKDSDPPFDKDDRELMESYLKIQCKEQFSYAKYFNDTIKSKCGNLCEVFPRRLTWNSRMKSALAGTSEKKEASAFKICDYADRFPHSSKKD
ncbi:hypothetical protein OESDEN_00058 [Oesophagostomum dentatum]|uniref:Uncharacterized protein n=1 Tax=Oesophagostomum dentatum TaxID=61180 RepID=A0A0B1TWX3_OESDE|nr:hypothetical protein OESDEN_00058 [Oesophagostomum dentatum]